MINLSKYQNLLRQIDEIIRLALARPYLKQSRHLKMTEWRHNYFIIEM